MSRIGYDAGVPFTNWHVPLWRNPKRQASHHLQAAVCPGHAGLCEARHRAARRSNRRPRGAVWINGKRLTESYTRGLSERPTLTPHGEFQRAPFHRA